MFFKGEVTNVGKKELLSGSSECIEDGHLIFNKIVLSSKEISLYNGHKKLAVWERNGHINPEDEVTFTLGIGRMGLSIDGVDTCKEPALTYNDGFVDGMKEATEMIQRRK